MDLNYRLEKTGPLPGDGKLADVLWLSGQINEDAEVVLAEVKNILVASVSDSGNTCMINFRDIFMINSCGVRAWIHFLREVEKVRLVIFDECTPEVVGQINMIPQFRGKAVIQSVYASYACDSCGAQKKEIYREGQNLPQTSTAELPEVRCHQCHEKMEMEEIPEDFFAWILPADA